jgi:hypothetical protein
MAGASLFSCAVATYLTPAAGAGRRDSAHRLIGPDRCVTTTMIVARLVRWGPGPCAPQLLARQRAVRGTGHLPDDRPGASHCAWRVRRLSKAVRSCARVKGRLLVLGIVGGWHCCVKTASAFVVVSLAGLVAHVSTTGSRRGTRKAIEHPDDRVRSVHRSVIVASLSQLGWSCSNAVHSLIIGRWMHDWVGTSGRGAPPGAESTV